MLCQALLPVQELMLCLALLVCVDGPEKIQLLAAAASGNSRLAPAVQGNCKRHTSHTHCNNNCCNVSPFAAATAGWVARQQQAARVTPAP
jgi:hypothetical protein